MTRHASPRPARRVRAAALLAVAVALTMSGCSTADTGTNSFAAGHSYGKALHTNFGDKASKAHLKDACLKAIVDHHLVDAKTGKPGKKVAYAVTEFVHGCVAAIDGK
jgi:uncharacterized protein YceK